MLQEDGQGCFERTFIKVMGVQSHQGLRPVEGLTDAGRLAQVEGAQALHHFDGLAGQLGSQLGYLEPHHGQLLFHGRVVDEQVKAAPLEGFAKLAGVVAGQDHQGAMDRYQGAQLRHTDLKITEHLQ